MQWVIFPFTVAMKETLGPSITYQERQCDTCDSVVNLTTQIHKCEFSEHFSHVLLNPCGIFFKHTYHVLPCLFVVYLMMIFAAVSVLQSNGSQTFNYEDPIISFAPQKSLGIQGNVTQRSDLSEGGKHQTERYFQIFSLQTFVSQYVMQKYNCYKTNE